MALVKKMKDVKITRNFIKDKNILYMLDIITIFIRLYFIYALKLIPIHKKIAKNNSIPENIYIYIWYLKLQVKRF